MLAYQPGTLTPDSRLAWFDRSGKQTAALGDPGNDGDVELSPGGTRVTALIVDPARMTRDIWIYDVARGLRTRFTFDPANDVAPIWSPDRNRIVFSSNRKGRYDLYVRAASGAGAEQLILEDGTDKYPSGWSEDSRFLLYYAEGTRGTQTGFDLWALPWSGDRKPFPLLRTPFNEVRSRLSSDGRWIAYESNESGRSEVYVTAFQGLGGTGSTGGGAFPRWRRDGREIFYLAAENMLMATAVNGQGPAFEIGAARPLFTTRPRPGQRYPYDVSADGQRFLVNVVTEEATASPITIVTNWTAGLRP